MRKNFNVYFAASVVGTLVTLASQNASATYFSAETCVMVDVNTGLEVPAQHIGGTIGNTTGSTKIFNCPLTSGAYSSFKIVGMNLAACSFGYMTKEGVANGVSMQSFTCPDGGRYAENCYSYTSTAYNSDATWISCMTGPGTVEPFVIVYYTS